MCVTTSRANRAGAGPRTSLQIRTLREQGLAVIGGLATMPEYDDWRQCAACRDENPELFFPVSDVGPGARQADRAKAVSARCPVRAQCLEYALDSGIDDGVLGGTTAVERRALRSRERTARRWGTT
jgi:WhiB family redox-sensing transcriptional regulator